jgi:hypothetical protein
MTMATVCGFILCLFIGLLALTILYLIWTNKINLEHLLAEADGSASMSRFQLLIFTFVIAISFFEIVEHGMAFPEIPTGVLTLLGISASTYAVGKGISYSQPEVMMQGGANADAADAAEAAADEARAHAQDAKVHADVAQQAAVEAKNPNQ